MLAAPPPPRGAAQHRAHRTRRRTSRSGERGCRAPPRAEGSAARSFGELLEHRAIAPVELAENRVYLRRTLLVGRRRDDDDAPVSCDLDRRTCIEAGGLEELLVEDEGDAVAGAGKLLDHVRTVAKDVSTSNVLRRPAHTERTERIESRFLPNPAVSDGNPFPAPRKPDPDALVQHHSRHARTARAGASSRDAQAGDARRHASALSRSAARAGDVAGALDRDPGRGSRRVPVVAADALAPCASAGDRARDAGA